MLEKKIALFLLLSFVSVLFVHSKTSDEYDYLIIDIEEEIHSHLDVIVTYTKVEEIEQHLTGQFHISADGAGDIARNLAGYLSQKKFAEVIQILSNCIYTKYTREGWIFISKDINREYFIFIKKK